MLEVAVHAAEKFPLRGAESLDDARAESGNSVVQDGPDIFVSGSGVGVDRVGRSVRRVFIGDDDFEIFQAAPFDAVDQEQDVLPFIQRGNHDGILNHTLLLSDSMPV
ncbi:hypothetical protein SDC9_204032 [bioreactor metagenome]|uniref:Uncharacterized protein n=1 Tax=bioreactor metagenome TaxID=1076179 RepID=A0A645J7A0_9ZZZZ